MTHEKNILLNEAYNALYKTGFLDLHSPLDILDNIVSTDFMGYGTARDERVNSIEDLKRMIARQRQQSEGADIQFTIVPVFRRYAGAENIAIYVDEITVAISTDDIPFQVSNHPTPSLPHIFASSLPLRTQAVM